MNTKDTGGISFSTVAELYDMIKNEDDLQIVDVRETSESFAFCHSSSLRFSSRRWMKNNMYELLQGSNIN
jgi:hypothetical protein